MRAKDVLTIDVPPHSKVKVPRASLLVCRNSSVHQSKCQSSNTGCNTLGTVLELTSPDLAKLSLVTQSSLPTLRLDTKDGIHKSIEPIHQEPDKVDNTLLLI